MELLSLKWNNHRNTFFHVLRNLRTKETYTDVTLACEGRFFPVHRLVLSTCSDYFAEVFEKTMCKAPVVIINGIDVKNLQYLLDYMYLGEVDVPQAELASLIKAAEGLQIKGLAVQEDDPSMNERTMAPEPSPPAKRRRTHSSPQSLSKSSKSFPSEDHLPLIPIDTIKLEEEQSPSPLITKEEEDTAHLDTTEMKDFAHCSMDEGNTPGEGNSFNFSEESSQQEWDPKNLDNSQQSTQPDGAPVRKSLGRKLSKSPRTCSQCQKTFARPSGLRQHLYTHTGERPFQCSICSRRFNHTGNLKAHMLLHRK